MAHEREHSAASKGPRKQLRDALSHRTADNTLELADLALDNCHTEEEQQAQLKKIKTLPCPIAIKRIFRKKVLSVDVVKSKGWKRWRARQASERRKWSMFFQNLSYKFELWRNSFKEIEGHFGSGITSYFILLKFLLQLNLLIAFLVMLFVVIPQAVLKSSLDLPVAACNHSEHDNSSASIAFYKDLEYYGEVVPNCSAIYKTYILETSGLINGSYEVVNYIADFFQGTGFMEDTALFYGFYSSSSLNVDIDGISDYVRSYNLPIAYLLVTVIYLLASLLLMVRVSAKGYRDSLVATNSSFYQYSTKAFISWDYALNDSKNVVLKKKSIFQDITHDLHEQRDLERREARSKAAICKLWTIRILVNLFVLGSLGGAGYLIYYITLVSSEAVKNREIYDTWHVTVQLLVQYSPSLTITALSSLLPIIFQGIVGLEDYLPQTEVQITLFRTVFFRLTSLTVLFATMYSEITCDSKDECNVGTNQCQPLHCWETGIGQQLYKLVITDMIVQQAVTLLVEFPRKLIVSKCSCKLAKIIGCQEFQISSNVLDLVYSQTLCWLGAFFSPLIPAICVIKFFILFYSKKISLLANFIPNKKPYKASKSNSIFIAVLMVSFAICCVPVVYVIGVVRPSTGCGPFRPYEVMYNAITVSICEWPQGFQMFLSIVTSTAFNAPVILVLGIIIYYQQIRTRAQKERVSQLKDQLVNEAKDKKFILARLGDLQAEGKTVPITQRTIPV